MISSNFDLKLLEILACPLTKEPLVYDGERQELVSPTAGLAYPISNGIPIMLIDEARIIDPEKANKYRYLFDGIHDEGMQDDSPATD